MSNKRIILVALFMVIVVMIMVVIQVDKTNFQKNIYKLVSVGKGDPSCYIRNCAEYLCNTADCCTCRKCEEGVRCNECMAGYHIDINSGRCVLDSTNSSSSNNNDNNKMENDKCYIKRGNGYDNEYCYGNSSQCAGFTEEIAGKNINDCNEQQACYKKTTENKYVVGKYNDQLGYEYIGSECPKYACYQNNQGEYRWTNLSTSDEVKVKDVITQSECVTPKKGHSLFIYIVIVITTVVIEALLLLYKSNKHNSNHDSLPNVR